MKLLEGRETMEPKAKQDHESVVKKIKRNTKPPAAADR
jgi:hypothetical protein